MRLKIKDLAWSGSRDGTYKKGEKWPKAKDSRLPYLYGIKGPFSTSPYHFFHHGIKSKVRIWNIIKLSNIVNFTFKRLVNIDFNAKSCKYQYLSIYLHFIYCLNQRWAIKISYIHPCTIVDYLMYCWQLALIQECIICKVDLFTLSIKNNDIFTTLLPYFYYYFYF